MKMHWNWDTRLDEIVFSWWTATTPIGFMCSFIGVTLLATLHQYLGAYRNYQERLSRHRQTFETAADQDELEGGGSLERAILLGRTVPHRLGSILHVRPSGHSESLPAWRRANLALIFGVQAYLSAILMLIIMTYNGYLILGLCIGSALGYFKFGGVGGGGSCHF